MQKSREMRVQSLGWEDSLGEEMATYSSVLAWEIPWAEEPGWLQSMESQRVRHDWSDLAAAAAARAENIKGTEELYKKDLQDQDNYDDMITHLEPDILECEVKWALESIKIGRASCRERV